MIDQKNCTAVKSFVAIDVAKDWNVVLTQSDGGDRRTFKVANRAADHNRLVDFMKSLPPCTGACWTRVVYAVIKNESDYVRFFEQRLPSGSIPLARAVEATSTSWIMLGPSTGPSCCFRRCKDCATPQILCSLW